MSKKKKHKKHFPSKKPSLVFSLFVLVTFFGLFFGFVQMYHLTNTVHVLGAQTVQLAEKTSAIHPELSTETEKKEVSQHISGETRIATRSRKEGMTKDTLVDCVKPDGEHATISYITCAKLNAAAGIYNYSFTPLTNSLTTHLDTPSFEKHEKSASSTPNVNKIPEKNSELQHSPFSNKMLHTDENEVNIHTDEDNTSELSKDDVKAKTSLPVSIDSQTHEVSVTTATGTKNIHVLPDKAVENLLNDHVLTNVETQSSDSGELTKKLTLTELNDQPVFEVKGVSEKKVFGIIPVAFSKTVFVSATDGTVVKTDQSLLNTILEKISL